MFKRESVTFAREVLVIAYYFNKEGVPSSFLPELEEREGGRERVCGGDVCQGKL